MKKLISKTHLLIIFLIVAFFYLIMKYENKKKASSPRLDFEHSLKVYVEKISFERNGLYINGAYYNAGGISGYSKIYFHNLDTLELDMIAPPFLMEKKERNDTLKIKKGKEYYLLVTQEINSSQEK